MRLTSAKPPSLRVIPSVLLGLMLALGMAPTSTEAASSQEVRAAVSPRIQVASSGFTFLTTTTWPTGYCAEMRVSNTTSQPIKGWTVTFQFAPGLNITSLWNGNWTYQNSVHTVTDQTWNNSVPAGGQLSFGFCGTRTVAVSDPFNCTLNGKPCGTGGVPNPPPAGDTQAPSTPGGLTLVAKAPKSVTLSWQASTDNVGVTGYEVFMNGGSTAVASPAGTSVSVDGLTPGATYSFTVKARDAAGNRSAASAALTVTTPGPKRIVGYFVRWGVYGRAFYPKTLDTNGMAAKLTHLNYAFGNVVNGKCGILASPLGDPWADYQMTFDAGISVDGVADTATQPLKGNLNQLKKLKAKYPNLKILIALGGWDWSGGFSDAVSTPEKRQAFAASCIDLYIRGNVPGLPAGSLAGVFDGIDIDWEFPVSGGLNPGRPEDTANFTAALAEFRRQLDLVRPGLQLSIATPSSPKVYPYIQLGQAATYLDHVNIMTYDMHGGWDVQTNFHAPLYNQNANPAKSLKDSTHEAVQGHLAAGVPAAKIVVGVPFYGRGWQGTQAGSTGDGLYQNSWGPAWGNQDTAGASGMFDYFYIRSTLEASAIKRRHAEAQVPYLYNPSTGLWVSYDDPTSLGVKGDYINSNALGGVMIWELSGDDPQASLVTALKNKLNP
ncbi:glycosyl hydrolase family 18 protein [Hyalangium versicolor]|uniref:glycosyl hydrolase family 18 protein n=1 Tax=Hyalangium versicolor TaxID=2861190 RepID=UPI00272B8CE5|nr:glycosyl hydrolase family 18 protein [Hyalangium versicolor]